MPRKEPKLRSPDETPERVERAVRTAVLALVEQVEEGRGDFFLDKDGRWTLEVLGGKVYAKTWDPDSEEDVYVPVKVTVSVKAGRPRRVKNA
jgi:hypothetical protein